MSFEITHKISDLIASSKLWIGDGYRAKNTELDATGIPFARAGDINDGFHFTSGDHLPEEDAWKAGNKLSEAGDVVFTSKGTVGRFGFVTEGIQRFVYSPQLCFWRSLDCEAIFPRFLFYWIQGKEFYRQYKSVSQKTDMAEYVSLSDQRSMEITLPELSSQKAIAYILGTLDDKIELNRETNETLEAMAKSLFKSWFVDFDPVRAKAEGRSTGLPDEISDLFPDSFEDSELGEIPSGWQVNTFEQICKSIYSGGTPLTTEPNYWNGNLPWFSSGETRAPFVSRTEKAITPLGVNESSTRLARKYSTVIASAGQGHTRGQASMLLLDSYVNQSVVVLEARKEISTEYYIFFDASRRYDEFRRVSDSSSSRGSLTTKILGSLLTVNPSQEIQDLFRRAVELHIEMIASNLRETDSLVQARDALLPKLISGEIRIPDAERMLEEVGI